MKLKINFFIISLLMICGLFLAGCTAEVRFHHPFPYFPSEVGQEKNVANFEAAMRNTTWKCTSTTDTIQIDDKNHIFYKNGVSIGNYIKHCYDTYYILQLIVKNHTLVFDLSNAYGRDPNIGRQIKVSYGSSSYYFRPIN